MANIGYYLEFNLCPICFGEPEIRPAFSEKGPTYSADWIVVCIKCDLSTMPCPGKFLAGDYWNYKIRLRRNEKPWPDNNQESLDVKVTLRELEARVVKLERSIICGGYDERAPKLINEK